MIELLYTLVIELLSVYTCMMQLLVLQYLYNMLLSVHICMYLHVIELLSVHTLCTYTQYRGVVLVL